MTEALSVAEERETPAFPSPVPLSEGAAAQIPDSVPHYSSFAHIADLNCRRAKEYEQYLLFSVERFPEFSARITAEIKWAQALSQRTSTSDRERVFQALEAGGELLCQEVAEDCGLPYSTIYKILRRWLDQGVVKAREQQGTGNKPCLVYSIALSDS